MAASLVAVAWLMVLLGLSCALLVACFVAANPQKMWIMNVVWPVTALWAGPVGVWAYRRFGSPSSRRAAARTRASWGGSKRKQPFPVLVAKGATHCGSGCALGDLIASFVFLMAPFSLFGHRIFGSWVYEFLAAFVLGIAFQYFTIKPMRHVSAPAALKDALKADTLSLCAWQIGMYGWMATVTFALMHRELHPDSIVFWFMMQIGMFAGFATAYPVNWWLLKAGVKEAM